MNQIVLKIWKMTTSDKVCFYHLSGGQIEHIMDLFKYLEEPRGAYYNKKLNIKV